jgi:hypothetical protein
MKEMDFHFGAEGTVSNRNFLDWCPLTIDYIQFHTYPLPGMNAMLSALIRAPRCLCGTAP